MSTNLPAPAGDDPERGHGQPDPERDIERDIERGPERDIDPDTAAELLHAARQAFGRLLDGPGRAWTAAGECHLVPAAAISALGEALWGARWTPDGDPDPDGLDDEDQAEREQPVDIDGDIWSDGTFKMPPPAPAAPPAPATAEQRHAWCPRCSASGPAAKLGLGTRDGRLRVPLCWRCQDEIDSQTAAPDGYQWIAS